MESPRAEGQARASGTAWYALLLLTTVYTLSYADRYLVASLGDPIKASFGLSDAFLGLLMGPAFALLFTVAAIPIARLADRRHRVTILAIGCAMWSLFTLLSGLAQDGWTLALMRVGVGIGEASFMAPAYSLLADRFPPERRGSAFGILALGIFLGQLGGYAGGPAIAHMLGSWRAAFVALGLFGIVMALLLRLTVREPARSFVPAEAVRLPIVLRALWSQPAYVLANLGMAFGSFSGYAFGMWGPALFSRAFDIPAAEASARFGLAFGPAGLVGALLFGAVSDRLVKRDPRWPLRLAGLSLFAATIAILCVSWSTSIEIAMLVAIPSGLLGGGWSVGVLTALQNMLPPTIRATSTALFTFVTTFIAMVFGPYVVGALSDLIGAGDADGLRLAMTICILTGLPAAVAVWCAARAVDRARTDLADRFSNGTP